ncbi:amino acid adenylation domain-containing protein [Paenibacillus sp. NPDC057934]|uniref:non-ribosomal peptide synthetase family protein n=1 Tax=Paenibacillus sp. NPDC057934 TaxID=3346282 RepID=UPI0036DE6A8C
MIGKILKEQVNSYADQKYWERKLDSELSLSSFPYDIPRSSYSGCKASIQRRLSENVVGSLFAMTKDSRLGVYMILLSGVKFLLSKYTGRDDIVVGAPPLETGNANVVSDSILLLRSQIQQDITLRQWLGVVKETVTEAFNHQQISLQTLTEQVQLIYLENNKPLIPVIVMFESIQSGISIDKVCTDIIFRFELLEGQLAVSLLYEQDLYDVKTMEHLMDSLFLYYESLIKDSTLTLADLDLLSDRERHLIFNVFNSPEVTLQEGELTLPELFERRVHIFAERTALIYGNKRMTYRELDDQSNQLASYLISTFQLKKEEAVMVYMNRSPYTYIAFLGILKAGGTFVPVDPAVPGDRVQSILAEAEIRLALTLSNWEPVLSKLRKNGSPLAYTVCLDEDRVVKEEGFQLPVLSNRQLAYIIFTSGSTGKPKGVEIEQRSVIQFLHGIDKVIHPAAPKVVLNAASIAFDLFISESLYALYRGMEIVIVDEKKHLDSQELARLLDDHQVELLMMTPSRLQILLHHSAGRKALSRIKMFLVGGQELKQSFLDELRKWSAGTIVNVYGPTEATCLATASVLEEASSITIGRPLQNYSCYILDDQDRLQVIGGIGELVIGGGGLARRYLNQPKLTDEKFMINKQYTNQRWYRTGDLARWLPTGEIQYIGRLDNQVKIRGYRIEIGDIEKAILSYPQINQAIVLMNHDDEGAPYLCSYLVCDEEPEVSGLLVFLKSKLPDYMIPTYFVPLAELPLTVNGKVNTKALKAMNHRQFSQSPYIAPSNDIQRMLADVWEQLLGHERIGIDDHFFQIGGTSLTGVKMVALLSDRYTISINDVFKFPTIRELSAHVIEQKGYFLEMIETMRHSAVTPELLKMRRGENEELLTSYRERIIQRGNPNLSIQRKYKHILLTGGTGFLGAHLLYELIHRIESDITLLIRGESGEAARQYLRNRFDYYFGDSAKGIFDGSKISIVAGDLTQPYIGVGEEKYNQLAEQVDCIIHTASLTKHYGTAEEFKTVNVDGTLALLDFAKQGNKKDMHFMSSMSLATGSNIKMLDEFVEDIELLDKNINNHFLSSKLEAEELIRKERKNGLSCTIYRLNSLNNNTKTGKFMFNKESNAFCSFVKGLNELGIYPDLQEPVLDLTGVDQAARAIVTLFDRPALHNQQHHIFNPNRLSWGQFGNEIRASDPDIRLMPFQTFISVLEDQFKDPETRHTIINVVLNLFLLRNTEWLSYLRVCERTLSDLNLLGFEWGPINKRQIDCYLEALP